MDSGDDIEIGRRQRRKEKGERKEAGGDIEMGRR